jgi:SWIRM-associated domain at the N-terminal
MAGTLEPRERGGPIQKFWDDPLVLSQLESIKTWLTKNVKKVRGYSEDGFLVIT